MIFRPLDPATGSASAVSAPATRALVTGASGFIGGHLVEHLLHRGNWNIRALVRPQSSRSRLQSLDVALNSGDVTDLDSLRSAIESVDVVFHVAGVVRAMGYDDFRQVNAAGVENVLRVCAERQTPPTVVIVSSLAAAGPAPLGRPREESDLVQPVSSYGRSKRDGELIAESYASRVPITIVRPPIVFGEHDSAMLALFRPILKYGFHIVPGLTTRRVSMIHASDLARLLLLAAESGERLSADAAVRQDTAPGYYFAASPEQPTLSEMGRLIGEAGGRQRMMIVRAPNFVAWGVGLTGELISRVQRTPVIVNCDKIRESLAGSWTCSTARAERDLSFRVETPLINRLRQTADFYRNTGLLA